MARASVRLKRSDGGWERQSLATAGDAPAGKEVYYRGESRPACEWAILDEAGDIALLNRFQPSQAAVCYLNWSGAEQRVNLELWSPNVTLKPGESLTVSHEYEVVHPAGAGFQAVRRPDPPKRREGSSGTQGT
jgi:hypothetical protein